MPFPATGESPELGAKEKLWFHMLSDLPPLSGGAFKCTGTLCQNKTFSWLHGDPRWSVVGPS